MQIKNNLFPLQVGVFLESCERSRKVKDDIFPPHGPTVIQLGLLFGLQECSDEWTDIY